MFVSSFATAIIVTAVEVASVLLRFLETFKNRDLRSTVREYIGTWLECRLCGPSVYSSSSASLPLFGDQK